MFAYHFVKESRLERLHVLADFAQLADNSLPRKRVLQYNMKLKLNFIFKID
jgi:uncharacterized protein YbgA (DUF1722 family)